MSYKAGTGINCGDIKFLALELRVNKSTIYRTLHGRVRSPYLLERIKENCLARQRQTPVPLLKSGTAAKYDYCSFVKLKLALTQIRKFVGDINKKSDNNSYGSGAKNNTITPDEEQMIRKYSNRIKLVLSIGVSGNCTERMLLMPEVGATAR